MPPAAVAAAGRLAAYVLAPSVDVPQVRLPRQVPGPSVAAGDAMCPGCGRAPRFGSAAYGVSPARLDLATASFLRCALADSDCKLSSWCWSRCVGHLTPVLQSRSHLAFGV